MKYSFWKYQRLTHSGRLLQDEMISNFSSDMCGLPLWAAVPKNDTVSKLNEVITAVVNLPMFVFAFLSNFSIILAVVRTPALQKPCNILLCSLASADCVTGAVAQPLFVAWRLILLRIYSSCAHQAELLVLREVTMLLTSGWSFVSIVVISFDRHYALSQPLIYRVNATKKGAVRLAVFTAATWFVWTIGLYFFVPPSLSFKLHLICGVLFILIPLSNHIRMFFAIRRQNKEVQDAVATQHLSVVIRREKKVANDMFLVTILLFATIAPGCAISIEPPSSRTYKLMFPWAYTMVYLNSSLNPILFLSRNGDLRDAIKSYFSH